MAERWSEWGAPLRPTEEDVELFRKAIGPAKKVLLLGVTPELQCLSTISIDNNTTAIKIHGANAIVGDWEDLPFANESFDAVIGDGSFNIFEGNAYKFFRGIRRVCKKGGCLVLRVFVSPEEKELLDYVFETWDRTNFHAFKWRVAQSLSNPYVPVSDIYHKIKPFWEHPTLDVYENSNAVYFFPKLSDITSWSNIDTPTSYELADRCPILTWNF